MNTEPIFAYAKLNIRLEPMLRGELFEDRLTEALGDSGLAEVTGGGTMSSEEGEVLYCGIDLNLFDAEEAGPVVCDLLDQLGAPKGSTLSYEFNGESIEFAFGSQEGLAIYLNGTDLPDETYQTCDANDLCRMIQEQLGDTGTQLCAWNGPTETAIYLYGPSFDAMKERVATLLATYPLCERARVVRIA